MSHSKIKGVRYFVSYYRELLKKGIIKVGGSAYNRLLQLQLKQVDEKTTKN